MIRPVPHFERITPRARQTNPHGPTRRTAAAAVEFAFVAPLLVLLVLGMVEFGRMLMVQQNLTNAAREGARKAVLPGATDSQVETTIDDYMKGVDISGHSKTISPSTNSADSGTAIVVTVSVPYDKVSWLPLNAVGFLKETTLKASVQMRKEDY
jgi:Flp pilus assembly protein TadG